MPYVNPLIPNTLLQRMREESLPSLAVAVARDGEILCEEGFGWADRENRIPATPHTLYSLASISKPICTTGLMVLAQRGLVDLDRPVNDYLGAAKVTARVGNAEDATVRRVANHTSGLPLHYHFFPEDEPYSRPSMDETLLRYGNLVRAPGEKYQYSNLGYGILDYLIERVSGKSFTDFMREEVFAPLGMTRASVDIGPGLEPYAAARYATDRWRVPFYDFDHPGASAVYCSAHDLVRFGMFHLKAHLPDQKAILFDESIDAMQMPTARCAEAVGYGVGWRIGDEVPGYRTISHTGGMRGVNTILLLVPRERIAVAVLANTTTDLPFTLADDLVSALVPGYGAELQAVREERNRKKAEASATPPFHPPAELLGEWTGSVVTYVGERPLTLRVLPSGDVHARLGDQLWTLLNDAKLEDGELTGKMAGDIGTPDSNRRSYHLHLDVKLRGDVLNGALTSISLPGRALSNALSHWVSLHRKG